MRAIPASGVRGAGVVPAQSRSRPSGFRDVALAETPVSGCSISDGQRRIVLLARGHEAVDRRITDDLVDFRDVERPVVPRDAVRLPETAGDRHDPIRCRPVLRPRPRRRCRCRPRGSPRTRFPPATARASGSRNVVRVHGNLNRVEAGSTPGPRRAAPRPARTRGASRRPRGREPGPPRASPVEDPAVDRARQTGLTRTVAPDEVPRRSATVSSSPGRKARTSIQTPPATSRDDRRLTCAELRSCRSRPQSPSQDRCGAPSRELDVRHVPPPARPACGATRHCFTGGFARSARRAPARALRFRVRPRPSPGTGIRPESDNHRRSVAERGQCHLVDAKRAQERILL